MNGHRHHIVGSEAGQSKPPAWVSAPPRRRIGRKVADQVSSLLIVVLLLIAGALWLLLGPGIMRGMGGH